MEKTVGMKAKNLAPAPEGTKEAYDRQNIRIGIVTVSLAIIANFIPALYLWLVKGIALDVSTILTIWALAFATFGVSWIVQPISYSPVMGIAGSYISWIAGSVADIRLPSANMARKAAGVEDSTPEGDVMSTIGVACSVFVSVAIVSVFTFVGMGVIQMLPESITSAFSYILPAVFGAVFTDMAIKNLKLGLITFVASVIVLLIVPLTPIPSGFSVLFCVIAGMLLARLLFVMEQKKKTTEK